MKHNADVLAERILTVLVLAGIAVGCWLVLEPFLSAIFWAGILVFTTWPVFNWLRVRLRLRDRAAAGVMVLLTAVLIVLPLGLAAPAGRGRRRPCCAAPSRTRWPPGCRARRPGCAASRWSGPRIAEYWNTWAADLSGLVDVLKPYFGMIAESGLKLLVSIAGGLLQFLLALVVAFFFYASGDVLARIPAAARAPHRRRPRGPPGRGHRGDHPRRRLRHPRHRAGAGIADHVRALDLAACRGRCCSARSPG